MLEAAEADLALEAGFVHVKARQAFPEIWPPSSSTRTNGVSGFAMAAPVARCQTHQLHPSCGTKPPLDMLMTLQGVYEKSLGTLSPSPRRSATVDALRAIGELDLSELD